MKNSLLKGFLVFLAMFFTSFAFSQTVSGVVSDSNGPLPGVSVKVKGNNNGQQTDFDGNYKIEAGADAVLVFTYVGFQTQEIKVAGRKTINVTLKSGDEQLKEVVVIGYGSVRKKDATGAVDQLTAKNFDNVAATNPGEMLRGKTAGVQVTQSSGEPGAGLSIRVRGNSSIRSGNNPLIVVDGVPLDGGDTSPTGSGVLGASSARSPLNFINQSDIESMSILKDASSTAIYGARGANGVIIITTKKGKSKDPQLNYNSSIGFSQYKGEVDVMSTGQYLANGGIDNGNRGYNWKDAILQNAVSVNNEVSYSSGSEKSNTRISLAANNVEGIVKNSGIDKYTFSLNNSNNFFDDKFKLDTKLLYAGIKDKAANTSRNAGFIGNQIASALYWNPTNPIYDNSPDGYFNPGYVADNPSTPANEYVYGAENYLNPVQLLDSYTDYTNTHKILGSLTANVKLTKSLKYTLQFGVETSVSTRKSQLLPSIRIQDISRATFNGVTYYGQATVSSINKFNTTLEQYLTYDKVINDNFKINVVGGFSYYNYNFDAYNTTAKGFNPAQTNLIDNMQGGISYSGGSGDNNWRTNSFRNQVELQSFYGRVNAELYNKLFLSATLRSDGSSKLGKNNKYGLFPSLGIAYKVVDGKEGLLNDLKVRSSYGKTGNQEFAPNSALRFARYTEPSGAFSDQINDNPDLKWEEVTSIGVGLDFTLLKNKLSGTLDYYKRETTDLIFPTAPEATQPAPPSIKYVNLDGILENTGIEATLNYNVISNDNFKWDVSANVSFIKNKVKDLGLFLPTAELNGQGLTNAFAQVITDNYPAYTYYLYEFQGYDATGNSIYTDAAGNNTGLGTASRKLLDKTPLPKMNLGFSTSLSYKKFDFSTSFYGAFGHYLYNNTANALFFKGAFPVRNQPYEVISSGQATGDPNSPSTKYLEKGDFLRMGNITLGYTFSGGILDRAKIKNLRFYVNGTNLLLFTKYTGFDPEVDIDKNFNGVPSAGVDYLAYPRAKTYNFGVNLTF